MSRPSAPADAHPPPSGLEDVARANAEHRVDDEEALEVGERSIPDSNKVTPLPRLQLFIAIFIQVAEPVTCTVIYPFVNDLIRELGITNGDEKKTGYYVGVVESIFYAAEALTVLHWGKASDIVGRKPILLGGMAGLALSMFGFGLSWRYWMLLASRCAQGAFNGNIGVTKSVLAEITDETNAPMAFAFLPVAWSLGSTVGPAIGGVLSKPAERWPDVFGKAPFFEKFPYFLPCFVAAIVPILAFLIGLIGLKETAPAVLRQKRRRRLLARKNTAEYYEPSSSSRDVSRYPSESSSLLSPSTDYGSTTTTLSSTPISLPKSSADDALDASPSTDVEESKPTFRSILIPQVLIPITNFMFLAFLDQCLIVLIPLVYSTPVAYGGLDLAPSQIGVILGVFGLVNGIVQVLCFPWVRRTVGHRRTYTLGIVGLGLAFAVFPVLGWLVRLGEGGEVAKGEGRVGWMVWAGIVLQLTCFSFSFMSYACMFMYISASAPTRAALGTTNGLAQLSVSGIRAVAPTAASSLFSFSLSLRNGPSWAAAYGGFTVYVVLNAIVGAAVVWSRWLPKEPLKK